VLSNCILLRLFRHVEDGKEKEGEEDFITFFNEKMKPSTYENHDKVDSTVWGGAAMMAPLKLFGIPIYILDINSMKDDGISGWMEKDWSSSRGKEYFFNKKRWTL